MEVAVDVVIADDHALFRSGLRKLLESKARVRVVGEAASGMEAVAIIDKLRPDVVFLDVRLPRLSGLEVLREPGLSSHTRVILLTAGLEKNEAVEAFNSGARGILLKGTATQALFDSIDTVMSGQYCVYGTSAPDVSDALRKFRSVSSKSGRFNLTPRELDVIQSLVSGRANKEIARELSISEQTVKHHVTNIFNKTATSTRLELTLFVVENGLLEGTSRRDSGLR